MFIKSFKQQTVFAVLFLSHCVASEPAIAGLLGGQNESAGPTFTQYVGSISPEGALTSLNLSGGFLTTVSLNDSGVGLIGGLQAPDLLYAAFVSSDKGVQPISLPTTPSSGIYDVSINRSNLGLIGGFEDAFNVAYAAFVTSDSVTPISLGGVPNFIRHVALNDSGQGILGGRISSAAYVAIVTYPSTTPTEVPLVTFPSIDCVAINNAGVGLIGGSDAVDPAAFIVNGTLIPIAAGVADIDIQAAAINDSGLGLIGGTGLVGGYAAFVSLDSPTQLIPIPAGAGNIDEVAINSSGRGIIGGVAGGAGSYVALVSPGQAPLVLSGLDAGLIVGGVAINDFGQSLIGGFVSPAPFAAIVSPTGQVTVLNVGFTEGAVNDVAINAFLLSQIPTQGLKGNNLTFANYINQNAPQEAFYFVPALIDGSLNQALESAAPTRNMISFNTVLQNSFYLTTNLSAHLRNQRPIQARAPIANTQTSMAQMGMKEEAFLAGTLPQKTSREANGKPKAMTLWFDAIGALAYQNAQHETPGFNPSTGGGTLAFDGKVTETMTVGGGVSYFFTHVHEKHGQGKSNIQQEDLFLYASWMPNNFYIDLGLWGGLFQTRQTRNILMSGFSFQSRSSPHGWQLVPHLELGWVGTIQRTEKREILWNLLGMVDWANGWQSKYTEKGSGPFNVTQKSRHGSLLRSEGGLRFSETLFYPTWNLIFQEKGSYVNIQSFQAGHMQAFLVGSPGSFTLQTLTNAQNLGLAQFSITAAPYAGAWPSTMLLYQGEFGSGYQSHELDLELSWNF